MPTRSSLPRQWQAFLSDVDALLSEPVELHCLGGFVVAAQYGFGRPTGDLDHLSVAPGRVVVLLQDRAGKGSPLYEKHRLYLEHVTIASLPEHYKRRLIDILPGQFQRLHLRGLEAHDLALSKLERNIQVDREDVRHLAKNGHLDRTMLRDRYTKELRSHVLGDPKKHDATLEMWIESFFAN
jgi:hypothetical protein